MIERGEQTGKPIPKWWQWQAVTVVRAVDKMLGRRGKLACPGENAANKFAGQRFLAQSVSPQAAN